MLGRVALVACYHGWHTSMGGMLACVVWVGWVVCLRGWCARVGGVLLFLLSLYLKYYPE